MVSQTGETRSSKATMADKKPLESLPTPPKPARQPRTVSFTIPAMPRPTPPPMPSLAKVRNLSLLLALLLVAIIGGIGGAALENHRSQGLLGGLSNQKKIVTSQSQLISQIAKNVGASVVSVNVRITDTSAATDPFGQFSAPSRTAQAAGTGIIISSDGLIITNRHVVPVGTTSVSITLSDGTELKNVKVLGRTSNSDSLDVAFLKIEDAKGHKLQPAVIGDSAKVQVGDNVVAIGNALGQFQNTVTSGIISGYGRSVQAGDSGSQSTTENLDNLFQTDAAINEGNSGGPLVNLNGQVIGINTAIAGNAQSIGFAIPVNDIRGLIEQVLKSGKFERPFLGVRYIPLTADIASQFDLKVTYGAYIAPPSDGSTAAIVAGSPAEAAGLKEGDVITEISGTKIDEKHSLTSLLDQHQPGDKVKLKVQRGEDALDLDITLGNLPDSQ